MDYIKVALEFIAMLGTMVLVLWGAVRYLISKIEFERKERVRVSDDLHHRINDVKDNYLRKDDFERNMMLHVGHIEATVSDLKGENTRQHEQLATALSEQSRAVTAALERIHQRMDNFVDRGREDNPCAPARQET